MQFPLEPLGLVTNHLPFFKMITFHIDKMMKVSAPWRRLTSQVPKASQRYQSTAFTLPDLTYDYGELEPVVCKLLINQNT